jgi:serine/threonine protein kinase
MFEAAAPSMIGVVLLLLVALLALVAEGRSAEGRWFALVNLLLAATAALSGTAASAPYEAAARAMAAGKLAYITAALAFVTLYMQLSALARDTAHPLLTRLLRLRLPVVLLTIGMGSWCWLSRHVVTGVAWRGGAVRYLPVFDQWVWLLMATMLMTGSWMLSLLLLVWRHGSRRRRLEVAWVGVGVILFDWFGLTLLAVLLPRLGLPTAGWSPAALAAGSMVMLSGMVLTRQYELEHHQRASGEQPRSAREVEPVRPHSDTPPGVGARDSSCRSCKSCGAVLSRHVEASYCPLDGGPIVVGADPWPGRVIDSRIVIEELLGAGGMGRVYRAHDRGTGRRLALKLLNGELAAAPATAERFTREARSTMRINSPYVVRVHDLGLVPPGIPYLTMELIEGPSLHALLTQGARLVPASVALLGRQLAAGLAAAHGESVVHRDLKPDNVLVKKGNEGDCAKIVDFGLAKIVDEPRMAAEQTTLGRVFGTPAYLSPEQAAGAPIDVRSDLYSLGVLLYRARAGYKPFEGTVLELIASHINELPPPLGDTPIDALIMRLLEKDPARRPDAQTLLTALMPLAGGGTRFEIAPRDAVSLPQTITDALPGTTPIGRRRRPTPVAGTPQSAPRTPQTPQLPSSLPGSVSVTVPSTGGDLVRHADESLAVSRAGNVLVNVLRRTVTLESIARMRHESRLVFGATPERFAVLSIIEPSAAHAVGSDVREASTAFSREFRICCAAIVIEGSSFRHAALRTLIAGIYLVAKQPYPYKIFERVSDGVAWIMTQLAQAGIPQSADAILAAADAARSALRAPPEVDRAQS